MRPTYNLPAGTTVTIKGFKGISSFAARTFNSYDPSSSQYLGLCKTPDYTSASLTPVISGVASPTFPPTYVAPVSLSTPDFVNRTDGRGVVWDPVAGTITFTTILTMPKTVAYCIALRMVSPSVAQFLPSFTSNVASSNAQVVPSGFVVTSPMIPISSNSFLTSTSYISLYARIMGGAPTFFGTSILEDQSSIAFGKCLSRSSWRK
jgi:hypothetical protein